MKIVASNHRDDIWLYCQCAIGITKLQSVTMQVCFSSFLLKGDGESQRKLYRLLGGGGGEGDTYLWAEHVAN